MQEDQQKQKWFLRTLNQQILDNMDEFSKSELRNEEKLELLVNSKKIMYAYVGIQQTKQTQYDQVQAINTYNQKYNDKNLIKLKNEQENFLSHRDLDRVREDNVLKNQKNLGQVHVNKSKTPQKEDQYKSQKAEQIFTRLLKTSKSDNNLRKKPNLANKVQSPKKKPQNIQEVVAAIVQKKKIEASYRDIVKQLGDEQELPRLLPWEEDFTKQKLNSKVLRKKLFYDEDNGDVSHTYEIIEKFKKNEDYERDFSRTGTPVSNARYQSQNFSSKQREFLTSNKKLEKSGYVELNQAKSKSPIKINYERINTLASPRSITKKYEPSEFKLSSPTIKNLSPKSPTNKLTKAEPQILQKPILVNLNQEYKDELDDINGPEENQTLDQKQKQQDKKSFSSMLKQVYQNQRVKLLNTHNLWQLCQQFDSISKFDFKNDKIQMRQGVADLNAKLMKLKAMIKPNKILFLNKELVKIEALELRLDDLIAASTRWKGDKSNEQLQKLDFQNGNLIYNGLEVFRQKKHEFTVEQHLDQITDTVTHILGIESDAQDLLKEPIMLMAVVLKKFIENQKISSQAVLKQKGSSMLSSRNSQIYSRQSSPMLRKKQMKQKTFHLNNDIVKSVEKSVQFQDLIKNAQLAHLIMDFLPAIKPLFFLNKQIYKILVDFKVTQLKYNLQLEEQKPKEISKLKKLIFPNQKLNEIQLVDLLLADIIKKNHNIERSKNEEAYKQAVIELYNKKLTTKMIQEIKQNKDQQTIFEVFQLVMGMFEMHSFNSGNRLITIKDWSYFTDNTLEFIIYDLQNMQPLTKSQIDMITAIIPQTLQEKIYQSTKYRMNENPIVYILQSLVLGKLPLSPNNMDTTLTLHMLHLKNKKDQKFLNRIQYIFDQAI